MPVATAHLSIQSILTLLPPDLMAQRFAQILLQSMDPADLIQSNAVSIAADIEQAYHHLQLKPPSNPMIRIRHADNNGPSPLAIIEILNDDMPFLVDSVMGEIQSRGLTVHRVAHPLFRTLRDPVGHLLSIPTNTEADWAKGQPESFILIHIDALSAAEQFDLTHTLTEILAEVRVAVADWPAMRGVVKTEIARFKTVTKTEPPNHSAEVLAFLE
jgi:glutamate dehydrogenase